MAIALGTLQALRFYNAASVIFADVGDLTTIKITDKRFEDVAQNNDKKLWKQLYLETRPGWSSSEN